LGASLTERVRGEDRPVLEIKAPAQLTLGVDRRAEVEYVLPVGSKAELRVNVGSLGAATEVSPGHYRAAYTPPTQKYPQVAIFALVLEDGSELTWTRVPLFGSAQIAIQSEPSVDVRVRVKDAIFGPVRTDRLGRASVPVVIPPGVNIATSIATDKLGNKSEQQTPIGVPAFSRLLSVCSPDRADAFHVFAVDAEGAPLEHAELSLKAVPLEVEGYASRGAGVYRVRLAVPPGLEAGAIARPLASLTDQPGRESVCELRVPVARLEGVSLQPSATSVIATDSTAITLKVGPKYVPGAEMQAVDIELSVEVGELSQASVHTATLTEVTWTLPKRFADRSNAVVTAKSAKFNARARVALLAGPVAEIRLDLEQPDLRADGYSTTVLTAHVEDAEGNPVSGAALIAAARGKLERFEHDDQAKLYRSTYRVPRDAAPEVIEVRDATTGVVGRLAVHLRAPPSEIYLGARGGYLSNFARVTGPLVLAQVGWRLPISGFRLDVGLDGGFYASSYTDALRGTSIATKLSAVPLLARTDYVLELGRWELRAFAGPGVLFSRTVVASLTSGSQRASQAGLLLAAGSGIGHVLGPGRVVLDLAYWYAPVSSPTAEGNAAGLNASLGYLAEL
jgi:hypothetical protein